MQIEVDAQTTIEGGRSIIRSRWRREIAVGDKIGGRGSCKGDIADYVARWNGHESRGARIYIAPLMVCMRAPPEALVECRDVLCSDTALPDKKCLILIAAE